MIYDSWFNVKTSFSLEKFYSKFSFKILNLLRSEYKLQVRAMWLTGNLPTAFLSPCLILRFFVSYRSRLKLRNFGRDKKHVTKKKTILTRLSEKKQVINKKQETGSKQYIVDQPYKFRQLIFKSRFIRVRLNIIIIKSFLVNN